MKAPCVALLTDFGTSDHYVGSLKGVILGINPRAVMVDVTHDIPSFDIQAGAFALLAAYAYFPAGTVFLAIVDPGVGTARRILLAQTERHSFIAPDNGLLSPLLAREKAHAVRSIENPSYFLPRPSRTFEGRDKMAPVAAWLSKGESPASFGPAARGLVSLDTPEPRRIGSEISGRVLYVDKYGNLTTNIPGGLILDLGRGQARPKLEAFVRRRRIKTFGESYGAARKGEAFFLIGSLGLVEIAVREGSAGHKLGAGAGDTVRIVRHG